jgi:hypothetical protein
VTRSLVGLGELCVKESKFKARCHERVAEAIRLDQSL